MTEMFCCVLKFRANMKQCLFYVLQLSKSENWKVLKIIYHDLGLFVRIQICDVFYFALISW